MLIEHPKLHSLCKLILCSRANDLSRARQAACNSVKYGNAVCSQQALKMLAARQKCSLRHPSLLQPFPLLCLLHLSPFIPSLPSPSSFGVLCPSCKWNHATCHLGFFLLAYLSSFSAACPHLSTSPLNAVMSTFQFIVKCPFGVSGSWVF